MGTIIIRVFYGRGDGTEPINPHLNTDVMSVNENLLRQNEIQGTSHNKFQTNAANLSAFSDLPRISKAGVTVVLATEHRYISLALHSPCNERVRLYLMATFYDTVQTKSDRTNMRTPN
jgi:hypothetical protein